MEGREKKKKIKDVFCVILEYATGVWDQANFLIWTRNEVSMGLGLPFYASSLRLHCHQVKNTCRKPFLVWRKINTRNCRKSPELNIKCHSRFPGISTWWALSRGVKKLKMKLAGEAPHVGCFRMANLLFSRAKQDLRMKSLRVWGERRCDRGGLGGVILDLTWGI